MDHWQLYTAWLQATMPTYQLFLQHLLKQGTIPRARKKCIEFSEVVFLLAQEPSNIKVHILYSQLRGCYPVMFSYNKPSASN